MHSQLLKPLLLDLVVTEESFVEEQSKLLLSRLCVGLSWRATISSRSRQQLLMFSSSLGSIVTHSQLLELLLLDLGVTEE